MWFDVSSVIVNELNSVMGAAVGSAICPYLILKILLLHQAVTLDGTSFWGGPVTPLGHITHVRHVNE